MNRLFSICAMGLGLVLACNAEIVPLYFQGFETDTSGWYPDTGGTSPGAINQVASGGGVLGLTAPDGSYYAEVTNSPNSYQPAVGNSAGYGTGGYTFFGNPTNIPPYPGSQFTQSMDVYIDTSLTMGPGGVQQAYWIDDSPSSTDPADAGSGGVGYGGEHNFRLAYNGSTAGVAITVDGQSNPLFTVTSSGWYDFEFTYSQSDSNPTDLTNTTLTIAQPNGTELAMETVVNNSDSEGLENQYLAGPGYMWLPVWENGFSGNTLGIDDVQAFETTPEPASFLLFGSGLAAMVFVAWRKRRAAPAE